MTERNLEQRVAELETQVQNLESMLKKFAYHEMSLVNRTACENIYSLSQIFDQEWEIKRLSEELQTYKEFVKSLGGQTNG